MTVFFVHSLDFLFLESKVSETGTVSLIRYRGGNIPTKLRQYVSIAQCYSD
jgi:hypothetical protein